MIDSKTPLDRIARTPLHRQIYQRFRAAIEQGLVAPGERVASVRVLAGELGVARSTVEAAYAQLTGEGFLTAHGQAGTVVSTSLPPQRPRRAAARTANGQPPAVTRSSPTPEPLPFQLGIPALDAFPRKLWTRLAARRMRAMVPGDMLYDDPAGHAALREAIAAYLLVSRGVACVAAQVFVTSGWRASLALAARTLLRQDDRVWIEDPGFPPTPQVLGAAGLRPVAVPVDADGVMVAQGMHRAPGARMAVVTPSHQAPLGVSMTLARRLQLLDWARHAGAWVVEDDYDGEYRYAGAPLPALKSLDRDDRVLYAGSFSKVLYPGLALGYLVVPASLHGRFSATVQATSNGGPQFTQAIVADFLREGHFARHLKKMRLLYARRRNMLASALHAVFGDAVRIDLQRGGMHLIARFPPDGPGDAELAQRAQRAGLNCRALSERAIGAPRDQGLLMGFTNIASAAQARHLAKRLHAALQKRAAQPAAGFH